MGDRWLRVLEVLRSVGPSDVLRLLVRGLGQAFSQQLRTKSLALIVAVVVFTMTRDEVQRTYTVPVRIAADPDRELLSDLPTSIELELRGPWTDMSQVRDGNLGVVVIDLRDAEPGPLQLDTRSVNLPNGIAMVGAHFAPVDLRFDPIVERWVDLTARIEGNVHGDFERTTVDVQPTRWQIRGARRVLRSMDSLELAPVDVSGARGLVERRVAIVQPIESIRLLGTVGSAEPSALVRVGVRAIVGERELTVNVEQALLSRLPEHSGERWPEAQRVVLRGPRPALAGIEHVREPIVPRVVVSSSKEVAGKKDRGGGTGAVQVDVVFEWSSLVDERRRSRLTIDPAIIRISLTSAPVFEQASSAP